MGGGSLKFKSCNGKRYGSFGSLAPAGLDQTSRMLQSYWSERSQRRIPNVYTLISTRIKCYVTCSIDFFGCKLNSDASRKLIQFVFTSPPQQVECYGHTEVEEVKGGSLMFIL